MGTDEDVGASVIQVFRYILGFGGVLAPIVGLMWLLFPVSAWQAHCRILAIGAQGGLLEAATLVFLIAMSLYGGLMMLHSTAPK